jgi:hypothetical protein
MVIGSQSHDHLPLWQVFGQHLEHANPGRQENGNTSNHWFPCLSMVEGQPNNIQDRDGAKILLHLIRETYLRIQLIWADGGHVGKLIQWVFSLRSSNRLRLEIAKRSDGIRTFYALPRRWVVERTFGWLECHRRLYKDYEYLPET